MVRLKTVGETNLNLKKTNINFIKVALMYVGTIIGAGFASGREIWQFFGVFGIFGKIGVFIVGLLLVSFGMITCYLGRKLNTGDMGKIIVPGGNTTLTNLVGYFMAFIIYTVIITMSAAGGSFVYQQFGVAKAIGGLIIVVMVIATVLGDFQRVSGVFSFMMPLLFSIVVLGSILVINLPLQPYTLEHVTIEPSPMAPQWFFSALVYVAYNIIGTIPVMAETAVKAKDTKTALRGAALGGFMLMTMALVLIFALQREPEFSHSFDLPMLAYSTRISSAFNLIYGIVLFLAIYSAATSTFYGYSTKIKDTPRKKYILIITAMIGYFFGLVGFKKIVAYIFPIEGYIGFLIIILLIINFFYVRSLDKKGKLGKNEDAFSPHIYKSFKKLNRFEYPDFIKRVTAGYGGESLLIFGGENTVLYDCGMAYCEKALIKNIEDELDKKGFRRLDYVLLSHTHYDHIGALPYILENWPDVEVIGSEKASRVFNSKGAKETMKCLSENAKNVFSKDEITRQKELMSFDSLRIDKIVKDGDVLDLGDKKIMVLETRGHTDCSLSYVIRPDEIILCSESTGVLRSPGVIHTAFVKSYEDSIESAKKLIKYGGKQLIIPHFGICPPGYTGDFFRLYMERAQEEKDFIMNLYRKDTPLEKIYEAFESKYWSEERGKAQPYEAFVENYKHTIINLIKEKGQEC